MTAIPMNTTLFDITVTVLRQYRANKTFDPKQFLKALNEHEKRLLIEPTTLEQLISNPKSKYHVLYNISGAMNFQKTLNQNA